MFLTFLFKDLKSKLTPLELKLLERVERERESMYVAASVQQTDKERREFELIKRSEGYRVFLYVDLSYLENYKAPMHSGRHQECPTQLYFVEWMSIFKI